MIEEQKEALSRPLTSFSLNADYLSSYSQEWWEKSDSKNIGSTFTIAAYIRSISHGVKVTASKMLFDLLF